MVRIPLHTLCKIDTGRYLYMESNHQLSMRSPEFIARQACPNIPEHAISVTSVERDTTHSILTIEINL
jgi:hypothetical protein